MLLKSKVKRSLFLAAATTLLAVSIPAQGFAASLAGQVGDKRYSPNFTNASGPCEKAWKNYVKASGHSAYAQTHTGIGSEAFFCGPAYNAPSQKEAEKRALAGCNTLFKKYKVTTTGACTIYASK